MKKVSNTAFHFNKKRNIYPQQEEYPARKKNIFLNLLIISTLLFVLFFGNSCKTCKCPAYSDIRLNTVKVDPHC